MKNLIGKVKDGIGKGVAVGLLGLTLGMGAPALANADNTYNNIYGISKALIRIGHEIEDQEQEQENQQYLNQQQEAQKEQQQNDAQAAAQAQEQQNQEKEREKQQYLSEIRSQSHYFACNSIIGTNWTYPQDYSGIKKEFKLNEPLVLVFYDPADKKGDSWKLDVYDSEKKIIYESPTETIPKDGTTMETGTKDGSDSTTRFLFNQAGGWDNPATAFGKYYAVWYLNDQPVGETDFTIDIP